MRLPHRRYIENIAKKINSKRKDKKKEEPHQQEAQIYSSKNIQIQKYKQAIYLAFEKKYM